MECQMSGAFFRGSSDESLKNLDLAGLRLAKNGSVSAASFLSHSFKQRIGTTKD